MATQPTQASWYQPSKYETDLIDLAMPGIKSFAGQKLNYTGPGVADFDPTQLSAQQRLLGSIGAQEKLAKGGADAVNYWTQGDIWNPGVNQMLGKAQEAAVRPITENFLQQVMPTLRTGDIAGGGYGGSRGRSQAAQATEQTARAVGDTSSKLVNELYRTNVEAQQRAMGMIPQMQQAQLAGGMTEGAVGDARQAMAQAKLKAGSDRATFEQWAPFLQSQELMALMNAMPKGTNVSTANNPDQPSAWMKALGGGLAGGAAGASFGPWGALLGGLGGAGLSFMR